MDNTVKVSPKKAYGREMFSPASKAANLFCELVGQANLTWDQLKIIKKLGFDVKLEQTTLEDL